MKQAFIQRFLGKHCIHLLTIIRIVPGESKVYIAFFRLRQQFLLVSGRKHNYLRSSDFGNGLEIKEDRWLIAFFLNISYVNAHKETSTFIFLPESYYNHLRSYIKIINLEMAVRVF